jgi:hypothetical protein
MAEQQDRSSRVRDRVFVRSPDGTATVVSSHPDSVTARLCTRHRITTLDEARNAGLLPRLVDLDALDRQARRVLGEPAFDRDAARRIDGGPTAGARRTGTDENVRRARVADAALTLRAADLADAIEPKLHPRVRQLIAERTLNVLTGAPFDLVTATIDADIDVHTDLKFASDVSVVNVGEVRIYQGARIAAAASHFIMRATSVHGGLSPLDGQALPGRSITDFAKAEGTARI